jgi:hypothetical protein
MRIQVSRGFSLPPRNSPLGVKLLRAQIASPMARGKRIWLHPPYSLAYRRLARPGSYALGSVLDSQRTLRRREQSQGDSGRIEQYSETARGRELWSWKKHGHFGNNCGSRVSKNWRALFRKAHFRGTCHGRVPTGFVNTPPSGGICSAESNPRLVISPWSCESELLFDALQPAPGTPCPKGEVREK